MPPGNDALTKYFEQSRARNLNNPKLSDDIFVSRAVADALHTLASEPTEVIYADEPDLTFLTPSLWVIPLAARTSPNVILYFHGGGYVTNSPYSHRKMAGHIAKAAGTQMLMIDYHMAPEHKFPAPVEDAVEAYKWLLKKGHKPENIISMGDSAGGNLATALPLKLQELGEPLPRAIVPISPWYDMVATEGTILTNVETDVLIRSESIKFLTDVYLKPEDKRHPLAHILDADPKGLPPMYLIAGGYETLRDNAEKFAEKAKRAGVEVELEIGEGQQHVYTFMAGKDENADRTIANIGKWVRGKLSS
jgi:acetyl esterase/lipase